MRWLLSVICVALIVTAPQSARAFEDGHALLEGAESESEDLNYGYIMYVAGAGAGARDIATQWKVMGKINLDFSDPFCVPPKITYRDLGDVVRVWLRGNPELHGLPSGLVIIEALAERFPCK